MDKYPRFAGIGQEYAAFDQSRILLQSIPYDGTSTWGKGADKGFQVFLEAAENMELYDIETGTEVYKEGIHIVPAISVNHSPGEVYRLILNSTRHLLKSDKLPTFFGGEHSISIGIIEAFKEKYHDLTVLQLDAHADLRAEYLGSPYNHACAMYRARQDTNLIQVGIRSMDISEEALIDREKSFFAQEMDRSDSWMEESIGKMGDQVYISLDLDVFDPSIFPATGTPEPGGMQWYQMLTYLRKVCEVKHIVGFDLVEFAPIEGLLAPGFLVAKLYYKLLSYIKLNDNEK